MKSSKKAAAKVKVKDLKAKKNPKGGFLKIQSPTTLCFPKIEGLTQMKY